MARRKKRTPPKKLSENVDTDSIIITNHSIERFEERSNKLGIKYNIYNPAENIKLLLKYCVEEKLSPGHRVERLINNNLQDARYYIVEGWRLVIIFNPTEVVLVTIEREKRSQNYI